MFRARLLGSHREHAVAVAINQMPFQEIFHQVRARQGLPLKDALRSVYASFLDQNFTMQIGLLLLRLERPFAIQRLRDVSDQRPMAA